MAWGNFGVFSVDSRFCRIRDVDLPTALRFKNDK